LNFVIRNPMRQVINPQLQFGEVDIGAIVLDPKSRDDIPQLLRGLQYIYTTPELRARVFAILAEVVPAGVNGQADTSTGRPGMEQWKILVLGTLRLGLNADYDRILELSNEHKSIRQMLGHSDWAEGEEDRYQLQTLKDNLRLFTPELLDRINQEVVRAGHALVKKSPAAPLHVRADSFVVETDVHYPTDLNLLWDAHAHAHPAHRRVVRGARHPRLAPKPLPAAPAEDALPAGAAAQALELPGPGEAGGQTGGGPRRPPRENWGEIGEIERKLARKLGTYNDNRRAWPGPCAASVLDCEHVMSPGAQLGNARNVWSGRWRVCPRWPRSRPSKASRGSRRGSPAPIPRPPS
jgi:hypothetical protein